MDSPLVVLNNQSCFVVCTLFCKEFLNPLVVVFIPKSLAAESLFSKKACIISVINIQKF